MHNPSPPPGWYPDPSGSDVRWWDGRQWTPHTAPSAAAPPPQPAGPWDAPPPPPVGGQPGQSWAGQGGQLWAGQPGAGWSTPDPGSQGLWQRNRYSFITFIIVAVYLSLNVFARIGIFGFIPIAMSARAMQSKEPLGPVALGVAIIGFGVGIALFVSRT